MRFGSHETTKCSSERKSCFCCSGRCWSVPRYITSVHAWRLGWHSKLLVADKCATTNQDNLINTILPRQISVSLTSAIMCCNKRRQTRAQVASANIAAAASSSSSSHSGRVQQNFNRHDPKPAVADAMPSTPREPPPPYTNAETQVTIDPKTERPDPTLSVITKEWLDSGKTNNRRPSFNGYHSFDAMPVSRQVEPAPTAVHDPAQSEFPALQPGALADMSNSSTNYLASRNRRTIGLAVPAGAKQATARLWWP